MAQLRRGLGGGLRGREWARVRERHRWRASGKAQQGARGELRQRARVTCSRGLKRRAKERLAGGSEGELRRVALRSR